MIPQGYFSLYGKKTKSFLYFFDKYITTKECDDVDDISD